MFESLDKLLLAGLGAMAMTREKAEKIFDDMVARGQAERGARSGFVKEMMDTAEDARNQFEKMISEQVSKAMAKLPVASRQDVERLEKKLDEVLKREG